MNRFLLLGLLVGLVPPLPLSAQVLGTPATGEFERSIVRVFAEARLPHPDGIAAPYFVGASGSGVVIGEVQVRGRTEYLILTNHHVAHPGNYVRFEQGQRISVTDNHWTGAVAPEKQFIRMPGQEPVALEVIAGSATADMALLRTVGAARELAVFRGHIGSPATDLTVGYKVFTSGFPNILDGGRVVNFGAISSRTVHHLGIPHQDIVLDFPVGHGQSGSPVVAEYQGELWLIGLVHAVDARNTYVVPYPLWAETLSHAMLGKRAASE